ncbi:MAG: hypothetical protein Q7K55_00190 [Candidatus Levybacteria bacterium]|nr:hypothetical protein [Candidatus Levybacteria bacterium]
MENKSRLINIFIALALSTFLLYVFGSLEKIKAYDHPLNFSGIKLLLLNIFLLVIMSSSICYLLAQFSKFKVKHNIFILVTAIISLLLAYYSIFFPYDQKHGVGLNYILIGDYLRDVHGINIYFMDWAGWVVTMVAFLTLLYSFLIYMISKKVFPKLFKNWSKS